MVVAAQYIFSSKVNHDRINNGGNNKKPTAYRYHEPVVSRAKKYFEDVSYLEEVIRNNDIFLFIVLFCSIE